MADAIQNIALLAAACFLCWLFHSGWPVIILILLLTCDMTKNEPLNKCLNCGGPADNGHDRCHPPTAYWCTECMNSSAQPTGFALFYRGKQVSKAHASKEAAAVEAYEARAVIDWGGDFCGDRRGHELTKGYEIRKVQL